MASRLLNLHLLFWCFGFLFFLSPSFAKKMEYDYVRVPIKTLTQDWVKQNGFIRDHKWDDQFAFGYLPKGYKASLRDELIFLDAKEWARVDHDAKTLQPIPEKIYSTARENFHTYETLTQELNQIANQFPSLVKLQSAGKSVEGRELWYLRVTSPKSIEGGKPKLLYVSSMHGDEVTGKEMMVYLLRDFTAKYGREARITNLLDNAELFIMPSMNPDGTAHQVRFNANGVDLNRDFPELNEDPFGGNRAPETKALMELHRTHQFALAMNFHGGALVVNVPWDSKPNSNESKFGDDTAMMELARSYANANGPMSNNSSGSFNHGITYGYEWYQVLGGMQDWAAHFRQAIHATLEISNTKWPSASALPGFWQDNRESLLNYLEGGLEGIHLKVVDASGKPLPVAVEVDSANRSLNYVGYVHRITNKGDQQVTLHSAGHADLSLKLSSSPFQGTYSVITMP